MVVDPGSGTLSHQSGSDARLCYWLPLTDAGTAWLSPHDPLRTQKD